MLELVKRFQKEYDLFGEHYDVVLEAARQLEESTEKYEWVKNTAALFARSSITEAKHIEFPENDGTLLSDMLRLFVLLLNTDGMIELYRKRGFEDIKPYLAQIPASITAVKRRIGRPGINLMYYEWLCIFFKCMVFNCGVFRVEICTQKRPAIVLKHCCTGRYAAMMTAGRYHRSGNVLGSAGCTDEDGAFDADFQETADEYIGHLAQNGLAQAERVHLSKKEWEVYIMPGDYMLSLHIPKGNDLSLDAVYSSVKKAVQIAAEYYPEYNIKAVGCCSWLLNKQLEDILGKDSKIVGFGSCFLRFPNKSEGKDVFGFVFPQIHNGYETLPENTRLERGLKKLYMDGGFIHSVAGIFTDI